MNECFPEPETRRFSTPGHVAYDAYRLRAGGRSLATGAELPDWWNLSPGIRDAWRAAASAVLDREEEIWIPRFRRDRCRVHDLKTGKEVTGPWGSIPGEPYMPSNADYGHAYGNADMAEQDGPHHMKRDFPVAPGEVRGITPGMEAAEAARWQDAMRSPCVGESAEAVRAQHPDQQIALDLEKTCPKCQAPFKDHSGDEVTTVCPIFGKPVVAHLKSVPVAVKLTMRDSPGARISRAHDEAGAPVPRDLRDGLVLKPWQQAIFDLVLGKDPFDDVALRACSSPRTFNTEFGTRVNLGRRRGHTTLAFALLVNSDAVVLLVAGKEQRAEIRRRFQYMSFPEHQINRRMESVVLADEFVGHPLSQADGIILVVDTASYVGYKKLDEIRALRTWPKYIELG